MDLDRPAWLTIKDAAQYLDVGEPTIYRWMREGKITYRKVGDSTRFLREDLDAMVQVYPSQRDAEQVKVLCPACHHDELVPGYVHSAGGCYFRPQRTKFWTLKTADITTETRMCTRCGALSWFGDSAKLQELIDNAAEEAPAKPAKAKD